MPGLPKAETLRRGLNTLVTRRRILSGQVLGRKILVCGTPIEWALGGRPGHAVLPTASCGTRGRGRVPDRTAQETSVTRKDIRTARDTTAGRQGPADLACPAPPGPGPTRQEAMNPAQKLHEAGQSLWLDSINRRLLTSGTLARYIADLAVTGLTSNPTILGHAMAASTDYDDSLRRHVNAGVSDPQDLVYAVAMEDLTEAADLLRPAWEATGGADGYVSVEVPPGLAYDAQQSIELARRLHQ
jgi:Transaldolase/Fructose-6-phosphate aldolase